MYNYQDPEESQTARSWKGAQISCSQMCFDVSVGNTINITQLMNHLSSCLYLFLPTLFFFPLSFLGALIIYSIFPQRSRWGGGERNYLYNGDHILHNETVRKQHVPLLSFRSAHKEWFYPPSGRFVQSKQCPPPGVCVDMFVKNACSLQRRRCPGLQLKANRR